MSKLKNGMTMTEVFEAMAGHNPGAYRAMQHIHASESGRQIITLLDYYGIYGADLYTLYSYKCNGLVGKLHTLLMATHMNLMRKETLIELAKDQMDMKHFTEESCNEFELTMRKAHEQTQKAQKRTQNSKKFI